MIKSILNLLLISIFVIGCLHAGSEVSPPEHFGKIKGQLLQPYGSSEKIINVTVVMNKYNDSLRSLKVPQYKIDSNIAPIIFHSDSLGFIDKDSIPAGRYELTFDGTFGPIAHEGDNIDVDIISDLLALKLYDFRVAPDSISIINMRMWARPPHSLINFMGRRDDSPVKQNDDPAIKWIENIIPDST